MSCYISARDNRFYGAKESQYAQTAPVTKANEFNAVRFGIREETEVPKRRDKTGTRTFRGMSGLLRRQVEFDIEAYFTADSGSAPRLGLLVEAALGSATGPFASMTATRAQNGRRLVFGSNHGLNPNQALATGTEIRFVESVPSPTAVVLNAPIAGIDGQQVSVAGARTYSPAAQIPSLSLYDYWNATDGIHRMLRGAGVDRMDIEIAGDYHTMRFRGLAAQLIDSASFESGQGGLTAYPDEPSGESALNEPVPGHLGQLWLGANPERFYTLTKGSLSVENGLSARNREFGSPIPLCLVPGERSATAQFEIYARGTEAYRALYQASRNRTPISMCVQLGEKSGQMCAIYLPSFVPEVPEFKDQDERQLWSFGVSRGQGVGEDEIHVAFA